MKKSNRQLTVFWSRLSFPVVWEPKPVKIGGIPKGAPIFSATVVIENCPEHAATIQKIQQNEDEIIAEAWPDGAPVGLKRALKWGPHAHPNDRNLTNAYVLHANAKQEDPPQVVMEDPPSSGIARALGAEEGRPLVYSGCEAHVSVGLFAYGANAEGGVGCALNMVMVTGRRFGRFDNRASANDVLANLPSTAPPPAPAGATPPPAPQFQQQPVQQQPVQQQPVQQQPVPPSVGPVLNPITGQWEDDVPF